MVTVRSKVKGVFTADHGNRLVKGVFLPSLIVGIAVSNSAEDMMLISCG